MKKLLLISLCFYTLTCFSQKKEKRVGVYSAYLYSVQKTKKISSGTIDSINSIYEDSIIKIDFDYASTNITFKLTNKTEKTIKIIWDEAAFISLNNETDKIFHKGIKYIERENSQPPTSIYKNTTLSDLIAPTSLTRFVSGQNRGWISNPLIPVYWSGWSIKIEYKPEILGLTMRIILPVKVDDNTIEYAFSFKTEFIEKK